MTIPRLLRTSSFRLAALYAVLSVVSAGLLFGIVYWIVAGALNEQNRTILQNELASLSDGREAARFDGIADEIRMRLQGGRYRPLYYRLETAAGVDLAGNLPALGVPAGWHKFVYPADRLTSYPPEDEDEHTIRLLALTTELAGGERLTVAIDTYRTGEVKEAIVRAFAWAAAAGLVLALAGGFVLSRGFLRRIDQINTATRAIIDGNLGRRIEVAGAGDEVDRLARNLNEMLDRLQALMEGLKQVSSDVAHDLRTPLGRLRQRLEDVHTDNGDLAAYRQAVELALQDAGEALATFSALLRIAQIEAGTRRSHFTDVDLSALVGDLAMTYRPVAEDVGRVLTADMAPAIHVLGDRELLTQMLVNLIENALRHTPDGAGIVISLRDEPAGAVVTVADDGPGIPADERDRVLRRFYRLEASRTTPGSGLGLALVAAVAGLHGIELELADNGPGLAVRLTFCRYTGAVAR